MKTFLAAFAVLCFFAGDVSAAQLAKVEAAEVEVYTEPSAQSAVVGKLKSGDLVAASNLPTRGFYKIRMPQGEVGWVSAEVLILNPPQEEGANSEETPEVSQEIQKTPKLSAKPKEFETAMKEEHLHHYVLRGFFDLQLLSWSDFATVTGFNAPSSLKSLSLELEAYVSSSISLLMRFDYLYAGAIGTTDAGKNYEFSVASTPLIIGVGYTIGRDQAFSLGVSAMGGLGFGTELSVLSTSDLSPNETILSSSPLVFVGKVHLAHTWKSGFCLAAEAGYRLLSTSLLAPSTIGSGSSIIGSGIALNYSGIFFGAGLGIAF